MNKDKRLIPNCGVFLLLFSMLLCCFIAACDSPSKLSRQRVHALLIILGNDSTIRESVEKNRETMTALLRQVSRSCEVHMTVMKSKPGLEGEVTEKVLANTDVTDSDSPRQSGIIKPQQVKDWIHKVETRPDDVLLVYYTGHGTMDIYGTHDLHFDPETDLVLTRQWLAEELQTKSAHLKMLITDTCSENIETQNPVARGGVSFVQMKPNAKFYAKNLFLQHSGILNITAASPGQRAYADDVVGGYFTNALTEALIPESDTNGDNFLSWNEVFETTRVTTETLYQTASVNFSPELQSQIKVEGQTPFKITLPNPTSDSAQSELTTPAAGQHTSQMVRIPAGEFQMGSTHQDADADENPIRQVYVDAFYIDKYEVTNAQYKRFVDANPQWRKAHIAPRYHSGDYLYEWNQNTYPPERSKHPVRYVSWYAAVAYAKWVGKRLPTEAEWEKAARGGFAGKTYPWGDTMDFSRANLNSYVGDTTPVGQYPPNAYGLHDMCGNIREWCMDKWDAAFYTRAPSSNPVAGASTTRILSNFTFVEAPRVLRGGSWANSPRKSRIANRNKRSPAAADRVIGFRCASSER